MRLHRSLAVALTASLSLACSEPPTQLVVVVSSNLAIPSAIESVVVRTEEGGATIAEHAFPLAASADLPLSFAIVPRGGDASRSVTIVAVGSSASGLVARHRVSTGFVRGESRLVRLRLDACASPPCEISETLAPESLPIAIPGRELEEPSDAGPLDATIGQDASAYDAGDGGDAGGSRDAGGDAGPAMPTSCSDHLARGATASGVFTIDPDGAGSLSSIDVFCEMEAGGGGWTLLLKVDGFESPPSGPSVLGYDSALWTGTDTLRPGSLSRDREEALLASYHTLPITSLRVEMWTSTTMRTASVVEGLPGAPLGSLVRTGETLAFGDAISWGAAVGQNLAGLDCVVAGINVRMAGAVDVRIGAIGSGSASCMPAAGWLGVGARAMSQPSCSVSTNTAGGARLCGPAAMRGASERFAIVFGR